MCTNHFDNWRAQAKPAFKYLNDHASETEFITFAENLCRLENIITNDIKDIFNKKDSFIFLALFDKFIKLGMNDGEFGEFLREFKNNLRNTKRTRKGLLFDEIDKDSSTKDKQVVADKLELLENLMHDFLHINIKDNELDDEVFVAKCLDIDVEALQEDMDFYNETLDELEKKAIKIGSKLLDEENRKSLLTMVIYSFREDLDLDNWLIEYAKTNNQYCIDQKQNFLHMKNSFEQYYRAKTQKKSA